MYILFDIGGTKMRIAVSDGGRHLGQHKITPTPTDFKEGIETFAATVSELTQGATIQGAAGGVAGMYDKEKGELLRALHLHGWEHKPLKESIEKVLGASVFIENDSALAGLGEALYGAGRGHRIVAYFTVSTGVGGVRIVDSRIDASVLGFEPGHHIIDFEGAVSPDVNPLGTLEDFISGSAFKRRFRVEPTESEEKAVWEELAEQLAVGLFNSVMFWSPEVIVLGGSMIVGHPAIDVYTTTLYLKKLLETFPYTPLVKKAELGDLGGLYGALTCLKSLNK